MSLASLFAVVWMAVVPSPHAVSAAPCYCLAGITLGEPAAKVFPEIRSANLDERKIYAVFTRRDYGQASVYYRQGRVIAVSVSGFEDDAETRSYSDHYGVRSGDGTDRLLKLRGKPNTVDENVWRYGSLDGPHWDYLIERGVVTEILVSAVPSLAPYKP